MNELEQRYVVCALYRFVALNDYRALREPLLKVLIDQGIKGSLLLAAEGINGTLAGSRRGIDALLSWLNRDPRLQGVSYKESYSEQMPFLRAKVRLKKEIVTLGVAAIDPNKSVGAYVKPADWNALIRDPEVTLIDTRNQYEIAVGRFKNAIDPETTSFREFPKYVKEHLDPAKQKKVAMYCTGGIRCEKSTAYLKSLGFDEVYHLEGGILNYLEEVPEAESLWQGECFVFDQRVTVNHRLQPGSYIECFACRMPVSAEDAKSEKYQKGLSCPSCFDQQSEQHKSRIRERQKQIELASQRGEKHLGSDLRGPVEKRRAEKLREKKKQRERS